eukprot:2823730-Pyramimonas_sp.AAC.1
MSSASEIRTEPRNADNGPRLIAWAALRAPPLTGAPCSRSTPSRRSSTTSEDKAPASRASNRKPSLRAASVLRAIQSSMSE